jgi:hypothetical protein
MARNAFHTSKGIGGTASIMAANVALTSAAMSSIFPPFNSGARGGSVDFKRIPRERVSAISFHHYVDDRCHQQTNCDDHEEDPRDFAKKFHGAVS